MIRTGFIREPGDLLHIQISTPVNTDLGLKEVTMTGEKSNGYGLKNMKERAEKLNALLEINSDEGKGTKITFKGNITHMGN